MNSKNLSDSEALLNSIMTEYGDSILRTCYLLSGNLIHARIVAQKVFIIAYAGIENICASVTPSAHASLLRIAMRTCSCPFLPQRYRTQHLPVSRILILSPPLRRIAVLCAYHGFSISETAWILGKSERYVQKRLNIVFKKLKA